MTIVIDVTARAVERDTYRPLFRMTDVDRRRERKVVRQPNDGPGATWEERVAASNARLANLMKPRMAAETTISDYVLLPVLAEIEDGVSTNSALKSRLHISASTVSGRCAAALRRGLIEARRDRTAPNASNTFYVLSDAGLKFLDAHREVIKRAPKSDGKVLGKSERLRPNALRNAILDAVHSGEWMSAAAIAQAIGRDSNAVSSAARRCVEWGYLERDDTTGIGTKALYRISDAGRYFRETGVA